MPILHPSVCRPILLCAASILIAICVKPAAIFAVPICRVSGFSTPQNYNPNLGNVSAWSIATGDFNGDGRPDVVEGISSGIGILVFINDGIGHFRPPTAYSSAGSVLQDLATGDFNQDGKLDIASTNHGTSGKVMVWLGNGDGTFAPAIDTATDGVTQPGSLATGDFNRDGKLDIVVGNSLSSGQDHSIVLFGDGTGHFTPSILYNRNSFLRVADFNGDGFLDVLSTNPVSLTYGDGSGNLIYPTAIDGDSGLRFAIGDFNEDRKPDFAGLPNAGVSLGIFLGHGDGTFADEVLTSLHGDSATFIATGDVNRDGHLDLVTTKYGGAPSTPGRVFVMLGNGNGTFGPINSINLNNVFEPLGLAVADFSGDGRADIAVANLESPQLAVLTSTCQVPMPRDDFDGDGKADLSVFRPSTGYWYQFRSSDSTATYQKWGQPGDRVVAGDYDGDLKTDLSIFRPSTGYWYIFLSSNNSVLAFPFGLSTDLPIPGDYDGDGQVDAAVYRPSEGTWYFRRSLDQSVTALNFGANGDRPVAADFDGDGKSDVAVFRPSDGTWYFRFTGFGAVMSPQFGLTGDVPVVGDFDGDGRADQAVFRPSTGGWYIWQSSTLTLKGIAWGASGDIPVPADYDNDGKSEIAVFRPSQGEWYILKSTGGFTAQQFGISTDVPTPGAAVIP